jgi:competence protein ComEC
MRRSSIVQLSCLGAAAGMVAGSYISFGYLGLAAGVAMVFSLAMRRSAGGVIFGIAVLLGGLRWYQASVIGSRDVSRLASGSPQTVVGTIVDEPEMLGETQRVVLSDVLVADQQVEGRVRASLSRYPAYHYGQQLRLTCGLMPAEQSPGAASLRRRNIGALCGRPTNVHAGAGSSNKIKGSLLQLRSTLQASADASLPEPQSSLLAGVLWGARTGLPQQVQNDFKVAGMSHQVAVSGFNTSIIAAALGATLFRLGLGRGAVALLSGIGIAAFAVLSGGSAAVVRAAAMSSAVLAARAVGRPAAAGYILIVVAVGMALYNPWLVYDVGFQLSLAATAGLVYLGSVISPYLNWLPERFGLRENMATTLAATLSTLPITVAHFGQFSIVGLLANAVTLPLLSFTMAVGGLTIGLDLVHPLLGAAAGLVAWLPLSYLLGVAHLAALVPGAAVITHPLGWWAAFFYLPLLAALYRHRSKNICPLAVPAP